MRFQEHLLTKRISQKHMWFNFIFGLFFSPFERGYGEFKTEGERNKPSIKLNHNMYMVT